MIRQSIADGSASSLEAIEVLDLLAEGLKFGAHQVRSFALMPLEDSALRMDMIRNPRLSERIDARLLGAEGWALPDQLDDFPQARPLIALLRHGPANVFRQVGFAWHGNSVARLLLSGDKDLGTRLTRDELRKVLLLRGQAQPDGSAPLPAEGEIDKDGELCIWCWMAALPERITALAMAVLLKDCCAHEPFKALSGDERDRRTQLADAWLRANLLAVEADA